MEKKFTIAEVLGTSWKTLKEHIWILVGLFVAMNIIFSILSVFTDPESIRTAPGQFMIVNLINMAIGTFIGLGYYKNLFQALDGVEPQFSAYGTQAHKFFTYFFASILYGIIVIVGSIVFIIPGIWLGLRLQFFYAFIVDENCGITESLKKSWDITDGQSINLFVLGLAMFGIILLGILALVIGLFIAVPLAYMMYCVTFRKLNTMKTAEEIKEAV